MIRINCKHADDFGHCHKKPKIYMGLFYQSCVEYRNFGINCDIAERHPRPPAPKGPPIKIPLYNTICNYPTDRK